MINIKLILEQRVVEYRSPTLFRVWYTLKALICLVLQRWEVHPKPSTIVKVALIREGEREGDLWDIHPFYTYAQSWHLCVGVGILKGWHVSEVFSEQAMPPLHPSCRCWVDRHRKELVND